MLQNDLLKLFTTQPGYKILDITSHADNVTKMLEDQIDPAVGRLSVIAYPGEHSFIKSQEPTKIHHIKDYSTPFRALPRDNDVVFVRDVLNKHTDPKRLLQAVYTTLANASHVVVISATLQADIVLSYLDECDFRASSIVDSFDEESVVITGKKMHMWGNGL